MFPVHREAKEIDVELLRLAFVESAENRNGIFHFDAERRNLAALLGGAKRFAPSRDRHSFHKVRKDEVASHDCDRTRVGTLVGLDRESVQGSRKELAHGPPKWTPAKGRVAFFRFCERDL